VVREVYFRARDEKTGAVKVARKGKPGPKVTERQALEEFFRKRGWSERAVEKMVDKVMGERRRAREQQARRKDQAKEAVAKAKKVEGAGRKPTGKKG